MNPQKPALVVLGGTDALALKLPEPPFAAGSTSCTRQVLHQEEALSGRFFREFDAYIRTVPAPEYRSPGFFVSACRWLLTHL